MTESQWIILFASFFTGGAFGAVITAVVTKYRNRRQPVGYEMEVIKVFQKNPDYPSLHAVLMVGGNPNGPGYAVDNLAIARITLINKGNQDIELFNFGVTLEGTDEAVDIRMETPDRHHVMKSLTEVGFDNRKKELDFTCQPFNRGEPYISSIYFTYCESPGLIQLSSPHSTKFVEIGIVRETVLDFVIASFKHAIRNTIRNRLP